MRFAARKWGSGRLIQKPTTKRLKSEFHSVCTKPEHNAAWLAKHIEMLETTDTVYPNNEPINGNVDVAIPMGALTEVTRCYVYHLRVL